LRAEGADVAVMLTPSAARFVGPLSFAALSRHPVETELLELMDDGRIGHIVVGDAADAIVVAPATAHWLGTMANGLAGDVVTATCLATSAPVVVAPAMDGDMWTHPATVANLARLREFGYAVIEPESGPLASGQSGVGRLAELPAIVDAVIAAVADRPIRAPDPTARPPLVEPTRDADLVGRHIVVTAGGTREAIDPVRFVGNRSTGRMGAAIAAAALDRGARVTVIAANIEVALPLDADVVEVVSTADLDAALRATTRSPDGSAGFDALVMAAAVADFRPVTRADAKVPRESALTLELETTSDLLAAVARIVHGQDVGGESTGEPLRPAPVLVGFAAETGGLERAAEKLRRKGVDLLVANDVAEPGSGFGTDTNRVTIFAASGPPQELPLQSKRAVADQLLDRVARLLDERDAAAQTVATTEPEREPA
jgi:phosphopantothenoylcysteine decarboxylase/phosphopantothenate--cysteine ligase